MLPCLLLAAILYPTPDASAAPLSLGRAGAADVYWEPSRGLDGIELEANGVRFRPFAGARAVGPSGDPEPGIVLQARPQVIDDALRINIISNDSPARGVDPGLVEGLGQWRRLDLSRQSEAYGQTFWQKTTYSVTGDFWFTAHWVMEASNGTSWQATNAANEGEGPFPAALRVNYAPDTDGHYLPVREVLEVRVSRHLWDVVPMPRQQPSEYRHDLAASVQLDLWGGTADPELSHFLDIMDAVGIGRLQFLSILQNWQAGGFDSLLPDSIWMPDFPPNPGIGTVDQLRALAQKGNEIGRFGFRTNYRILRSSSPSYLAGLAHFALDASGKSLDYLAPADWPTIAGRQETEIQQLFSPRASFTDQLTSGACPGAWHDYSARGGSRSMRQTLARQRALARLIRQAHQGPLGSESLMDQELLGEFVDTGDFGIMDAHHRLFSPEFKLRRLHALTAFHGMGLMYRFYEMPPYPAFHSGRTTFGADQAQLDDYRACEVLYGNGAYVCYPFASWSYWLTECMLIGNLQRHYLLQPVQSVEYWRQGEWVTLEDLVRAGVTPNSDPWSGQPTSEFGRVRTRYANGLTVVVNRLPEPLDVPVPGALRLTLPRSGWAAWTPDGTVLAYSALSPGAGQRVDYLRDAAAGIEFLDPRGATLRGVSQPTLWLNGEPAVTVDIASNTVTVQGRQWALDLPQPPPPTRLDFSFTESLQGWRIGEGILAGAVTPEGLALRIVSPDPQLYSPPLAVAADDTPALEIRLQASAGELAQLYFTTDTDRVIDENKVFRIPVVADGQFHTCRVACADHPSWRGTITSLRLDPIHGPSRCQLTLAGLTTVPR